MTTLVDDVLTFSVQKVAWKDSHEYSPILQVRELSVEQIPFACTTHFRVVL